MGQSSRSAEKEAGLAWLLPHIMGWRSALELTVDILLDTGKVNGLDTTDLLAGKASDGRTSDGRGASRSVQSSDKGALLTGGPGQLAGCWAQGGSETSGRHDGLF